MNWLFPAVTASLLNTVILFFVYLYLYKRDRSDVLRLWCAAWFFYAVRFVFILLIIAYGTSKYFLVANQLAAFMSAVFILAGSYLWLKRKVPYLIYIIVPFLSAWIFFSTFTEQSFLLITLPTFLFLGIIFIATGIILLRYSENKSFGVVITAVAFIIWGIHKVDYPFLQPVAWFAPWGYLIAAALAMLTAVGMILIYLEGAQSSLSASNERFKQLAENIPQVFWVINLSYDEILYISPSYEKVWGKSRDDLLKNPRTWIDSIVEEDREKVISTVSMLGLNPQQVDFPEYRIQRPDGEVRWIQARGFPVVNDRGEVYRIAGIAEDVTEKKKTFELFLQSEKLMTVGGLAAGIAHEINNPLSIISQGVQLIHHRFDPAHPLMAEMLDKGDCGIEFFEELKQKLKINRYLDNILKAVQRASVIVENMLSFSSPRSVTRDFIDFNMLLEEALELVVSEYDFAKKFDFKNIDIIKHYQNEMPPLPCVKGEMEQVVINILKNAAFAFQGLGEREVNNRIELSTSHDGDSFQLVIEDNGPGMEETIRKRIFEPFFTTKEEGKGTGLGMFVSYFIVTSKHGGSITVDSNPGSGTAFTITLPSS